MVEPERSPRTAGGALGPDRSFPTGAPTSPQRRPHGSTTASRLAVAGLVVGGFGVQCGLLGVVAWRLVGPNGAASQRSPLVAVVTVAALLVAVLAMVTIVRAAETKRRDDADRAEVAWWCDVWRAVVDGRIEPPSPTWVDPLPVRAIVAALDLRDAERSASDDGPAAARRGPVADLIDRCGIGAQLLVALSAEATDTRRPAGLIRLVELVGRVGLPTAVDQLLPLLGHDDPTVRTMSLRAICRSVAAEPDAERRARLAATVVDAIDGPVAQWRRAGRPDLAFPRAALDEALFLLGPATRAAIGAVFDAPYARPLLLTAAVDTVGRRFLLEFGPRVATFAEPAHPVEVRAAAWRTLAVLGQLPRAAVGALERALVDPAEAVRVQATRSARLLPGEDTVALLVQRLADDSWWVRRAAAEALGRRDPDGANALRRAAVDHPSDAAREVATHHLLELGELDGRDAELLRSAR